MSDKNVEEQNPSLPAALTDDQIVTERKLPRRSFLATTGVVLAGAAAIVSGVRANATPYAQDPDQQSSDPDKAKHGDPDKAKGGDPDKAKHGDADKGKGGDADKQKGADPDKKKGSDPDKQKGSDPDSGK